MKFLDDSGHFFFDIMYGKSLFGFFLNTLKKKAGEKTITKTAFGSMCARI